MAAQKNNIALAASYRTAKLPQQLRSGVVDLDGDRLRTHRLFVVVLDFVPDMLRKYLRRSFRAKYGVAWSPALGRTWFNGGKMPP